MMTMIAMMIKNTMMMIRWEVGAGGDDWSSDKDDYSSDDYCSENDVTTMRRMIRWEV